MHAKGALLGHVEVHDTEDTLLHLTSIRGAKNNELLLSEIDGDRGLVTDILDSLVGDELTSVHDGKIGTASSEVLLDRLEVTANEHLLHEEGVVGPARDHTRLNAVLLVPACISVDDENLRKKLSKLVVKMSTYPITEVKEVASTALVGIVALDGAFNVNITPVDSLDKEGTNKTGYTKMNIKRRISQVSDINLI